MWIENEFIYTTGILRAIARDYDNLYGDCSFRDLGGKLMNLFEVAEHKAGFDMSLRSLGKRMRAVVQADIEGIPDYVMEQKGFYEVGKFKRMAYRQMANWLNGVR